MNDSDGTLDHTIGVMLQAGEYVMSPLAFQAAVTVQVSVDTTSFYKALERMGYITTASLLRYTVIEWRP